MGSSSSKPSSGATTPHVWKGSSPSSISGDMIESLQSSPETDTSRLQTLELQTQKRVAAELKKLQEQEAAALRDAKENISTAAAADASNVESAMSRHTVAREVEGLRKKLEERRQVRALPEGVETARGAVVRCLRENDRRPLDCWQEVERFKEEVRKLEKGWVEKVVS